MLVCQWIVRTLTVTLGLKTQVHSFLSSPADIEDQPTEEKSRRKKGEDHNKQKYI